MSFVAVPNAKDLQKISRSSRPGTPRREYPRQNQLPPFVKFPVAGQPLLRDNGSEPPQIQLGDRVHPSIQRCLKLPPLTSASAIPALELAPESDFNLKSATQKPLPLPEKWSARNLASSDHQSSASVAAPWWQDAKADGEHEAPDLQDGEALSRPQSASAVLSEGFDPVCPLARRLKPTKPLIAPTDTPRKWWQRRTATQPEAPKAEVSRDFEGTYRSQDFDSRTAIQKTPAFSEKCSADNLGSSDQSSSASITVPGHNGKADGQHEVRDGVAPSTPQSAGAVPSMVPEVPPAARLVPTKPLLAPRDMYKKRVHRRTPTLPAPKPEVSHGVRDASPEMQPRHCHRHIEKA